MAVSAEWSEGARAATYTAQGSCGHFHVRPQAYSHFQVRARSVFAFSFGLSRATTDVNQSKFSRACGAQSRTIFPLHPADWQDRHVSMRKAIHHVNQPCASRGFDSIHPRTIATHVATHEVPRRPVAVPSFACVCVREDCRGSCILIFCLLSEAYSHFQGSGSSVFSFFITAPGPQYWRMERLGARRAHYSNQSKRSERQPMRGQSFSDTAGHGFVKMA